MKYAGAMSILCIAAMLVACSGGGSAVGPTSSERHARFVMMGCGDSCDKTNGTPAPAPTPDVPGEVYCHNAGGDFLDITGQGGTGLSCAGGSNGGGSIVGSKCGIKFWMSGGGKSTVTLPDGTTFDAMVSGLEINSDDCSYQLSY